MTKEQYLEMCEMLNSAPKEDEIPVEFEDFPIEVQEAIVIYNLLVDTWDTMNGRYTGKSFAGFGDICEMSDVTDKEDRKFVYQIVRKIDGIRQGIINKKNAEKTKKPPK